METEEKLLNRITVNPKVMAGKPIIKGTRIPVEQVLRLLAQGITPEQILKDYPHLTKDDIMAALLYAAELTGLLNREDLWNLVKAHKRREVNPDELERDLQSLEEH